MAGAVLVLSACMEGYRDPAARLLTNETRASVLLEDEVPALGFLAEALELEEELEDALLLWASSWEVEGVDRWVLRGAAYDAAVPVLSRAPELAQRRVVEATRQAASALGAVPPEALPLDLRTELDRAVEGSREAEEAWRDDRRPDALRLALEAADRIRELTAPVVAERLIRRIEGRDEADGDGSIDEVSLERAERLLAGARDALNRGDYPRAIRRAHYAEQLFLNGSESP